MLKKLKIGFTGTRSGCTKLQRHRLEWLMIEIVCYVNNINIVGIHGDCVGADAEFHAICRDRLIKDVWMRPCHHENMRAVTDAEQIAEPADSLERNKLIVEDSDILVVCPQTHHEVLRSGTWSTVRYAQKISKPHFIIYPDGSMQQHGPDANPIIEGVKNNSM